MVILKALFLFFLVLFPLGQLTRVQLPNSIAIHLTDVILVFLFGSLLGYKIYKKTRPKSFFLKPILIFLAISFLTLIINARLLNISELIVSFLYIARFILYLGIYFVILEFDSFFKKKIPYFMLISGFFMILIGYIQYFFYPNLRNLYYLGWDEHMYRMFSTILDPNFAGAFFVLYLLLIMGLFLKHFQSKRLWTSIILGFLGVLTLASVFLTFSRSALLMLIFSTLIFLILTKKIKFFIPIILILSIFIFFVKDIKTENMNIFRTASSEARIGSASKAIQIIKRNPIIGVGFNAYRYAQVRYGFKDAEKTKLSHADAGTDNSFLFVLATTGIIGFFAYLNIWRVVFSKTLTHLNKNKTFSIILISSIIGVFINSLFINSLFFPIILQWIWMLMGIIDTEPHSTSSVQASSG